jgi:hypothetical protein
LDQLLPPAQHKIGSGIYDSETRPVREIAEQHPSSLIAVTFESRNWRNWDKSSFGGGLNPS